jgi:short-subunit dehydrogenase
MVKALLEKILAFKGDEGNINAGGEGMGSDKPCEWCVCATLAVLILLALPSVLWTLIYVSNNAYMLFMGPVNLVKKYDAKWALVTGGGTGIGRSLCFALAAQGLNVVLVSLDDEALQNTTKDLKKQFPKQKFRAIGTTFDHKTNYIDKIIRETDDIDCIECIFNNAGYIVTQFFDRTTMDAQLANVECNSTSTVKITHHFLQKMLQKKKRGCIVFTSSVSGYIPNPFAVMYGATKSFVSQFAASLAVEVRAKGIDVLAVHPSPVASNFFDKAAKLDSLELAQNSAVAPDSVPTKILSCIGRTHLGDMGSMAWGVRMGTAIVPYDFIACLFSYFSDSLGDYKKYDEDRGNAAKRK